MRSMARTGNPRFSGSQRRADDARLRRVLGLNGIEDEFAPLGWLFGACADHRVSSRAAVHDEMRWRTGCEFFAYSDIVFIDTDDEFLV